MRTVYHKHGGGTRRSAVRNAHYMHHACALQGTPVASVDRFLFASPGCLRKQTVIVSHQKHLGSRTCTHTSNPPPPPQYGGGRRKGGWHTHTNPARHAGILTVCCRYPHNNVTHRVLIQTFPIGFPCHTPAQNKGRWWTFWSIYVCTHMAPVTKA
jgi:hypothetical protein